MVEGVVAHAPTSPARPCSPLGPSEPRTPGGPLTPGGPVTPRIPAGPGGPCRTTGDAVSFNFAAVEKQSRTDRSRTSHRLE
jgi:hypothetical protein